ncbi:MAG: hypothetical protein IJA94_00660 [Bacilli bacterium]|nr:hypothetical protein [Bacilli bacterium]
MKFSSEGCDRAAGDLNTAATNLDRIINNDLENVMNNIKGIYESPAAEEMYSVHTNMKNSFKDFEEAVRSCSKYLTEVVKPAYEGIEKAAQSKIQ